MPTLKHPLIAVPPTDSLDVGTVRAATALGDFAAGDDTSSIFYAPSSFSFEFRRANGAKLVWGGFNEFLTISTSASTDTTALLPSFCLLFAVSVRVVAAIPGTANFAVTNSVFGYSYARSSPVSSAAGSTDPGNQALPFNQLGPSPAAAIRITPDASPSADTGRVRIVAYWCVPVAPTS